MTNDELLNWLVENMKCDGCPMYDDCYPVRQKTCREMLKKYLGLDKKRKRKEKKNANAS